MKKIVKVGMLVLFSTVLVACSSEGNATNSSVVSESSEKTLSSAEIEESKAAEEEARITQESIEAEELRVQESIEAEELRVQESIDAEIEEKLKKAEEERNDPATYNTGITYDNLARNPEKYEGEKITFSGRVVQVMEDDGYSQYRVAVDDNYDTILYIEIQHDLLESRILEDDFITIYGESIGTISYESTNSGTITIPAAIVNIVENNF